MVLTPALDGFEVRFIPAVRAHKDYVCPECTNPVPAHTEGADRRTVYPPGLSSVPRMSSC